MTYRDDPEYRKIMDETIAWLADGRELDRLERLVKEAKAHPRKKSSNEYKVKNPDGTVAELRPRSKTSKPERQLKVVGIPRNPILKLAFYLQEHGPVENRAPKPGRRQALPASALHRMRTSNHRHNLRVDHADPRLKAGGSR